MPKPRSPSVESYAHKAAKAVFAGWLEEVADTSDGGWVCFGAPSACISWRPGQVWTEYPLAKANPRFNPPEREGFYPVWREVSPAWSCRPPTFGELAALGQAPEFIFDIAIEHKGRLLYAIEIVHKHPPGDKKIRVCRELGIELVVVPAAWVLGQVGVPHLIPREFFAA